MNKCWPKFLSILIKLGFHDENVFNFTTQMQKNIGSKTQHHQELSKL